MSWSDRPDWDLVGEPLRPAVEDVEFIADYLGHYTHRMSMLVLGATERLVTWRWTGATSLCCADRVQERLDTLPPHDGHNLCIDWMHLDQAYDVVLGDSALNQIADLPAFATKLHELVRPGGHLVTRLFTPVDFTPEDVYRQLVEGKFHNFNDFKCHLQRSLAQGGPWVRWHEIWQSWAGFCRTMDVPRLFHRLGWRLALADSMQVYRDSPAVFTYPTISQVERLLPGFHLTHTHKPTYPHGNTYPTICFRRKS